jgi:type 1 fimbria pilin
MKKNKSQLLTTACISCKAVSIVLLMNIVTISSSYAGWWRTEQNMNLEASFGTISLNSNQNQAGQVFPANAVANIDGQAFTTHCDAGTVLPFPNYSPIYITGEYLLPVIESENGRNYVKVNDYLSAAVRYSYNATQIWLPVTNTLFAYPQEKCGHTQGHTGTTTFQISLKVLRPFTNSITFKTPVAVFYTGDGAGSAKLHGAGQVLYLTGTVVVPQTCRINADDRLDIDFGNISANAFAQAGVGNKPAGVNIQTRTLAIQCTNIEAQALLSLRVETDQASGEIIQSDNPAIGFKMADQNNKVLLPNNINSFIPFVNQNPANVTIKAWPVSSTNTVPTLGPFRARGYLRVDFN